MCSFHTESFKTIKIPFKNMISMKLKTEAASVLATKPWLCAGVARLWTHTQASEVIAFSEIPHKTQKCGPWPPPRSSTQTQSLKHARRHICHLLLPHCCSYAEAQRTLPLLVLLYSPVANTCQHTPKFNSPPFYHQNLDHTAAQVQKWSLCSVEN